MSGWPKRGIKTLSQHGVGIGGPCWYGKTPVYEGNSPEKEREPSLAQATMPELKLRKIAFEHLRPINQGLESVGSVTNFAHYIEMTYKPIALFPHDDKHQRSFRRRHQELPGAGIREMCLSELTPLSLPVYFLRMTSLPEAACVSD
jgi:hypothetical protein